MALKVRGEFAVISSAWTGAGRSAEVRQDFRSHVAAERAFWVVDEPHVEHLRGTPVAAARGARAALVIAVGGRVVREGDDRAGRPVEAQIVVMMPRGHRAADLRTGHPVPGHDVHRPDKDRSLWAAAVL